MVSMVKTARKCVTVFITLDLVNDLLERVLANEVTMVTDVIEVTVWSVTVTVIHFTF